MILIILVAIPIGVLSAVRQNSLFDKVTAVFVFTGFAVPTFWLALSSDDTVRCTPRLASHIGYQIPEL